MLLTNRRWISMMLMIVGLLLYMASFAIVDSYGILYLLSAGIAQFLLPRDNPKRSVIQDARHKSMNLLLLILAVVAYFTLMDLFLLGKLDSGLWIGKVQVLPTSTFLLWLLLPVFYIRFYEKEKLLNKFRISLPIVCVLLVMTFPILFRILMNVTVLSGQMVTNDRNLVNELYQIIVIAALAEELFFRGMLYSLVRKWFHACASAFITALLFSLAHLSLLKLLFATGDGNVIIHLLAIFILGLITAFLYEHTGSLLAPILFHAVVNGGYGVLMELLLQL